MMLPQGTHEHASTGSITLRTAWKRKVWKMMKWLLKEHRGLLEPSVCDRKQKTSKHMWESKEEIQLTASNSFIISVNPDPNFPLIPISQGFCNGVSNTCLLGDTFERGQAAVTWWGPGSISLIVRLFTDCLLELSWFCQEMDGCRSPNMACCQRPKHSGMTVWAIPVGKPPRLVEMLN